MFCNRWMDAKETVSPSSFPSKVSKQRSGVNRNHAVAVVLFFGVPTCLTFALETAKVAFVQHCTQPKSHCKTKCACRLHFFAYVMRV